MTDYFKPDAPLVPFEDLPDARWSCGVKRAHTTEVNGGEA
jgi:hypothetical protein